MEQYAPTAVKEAFAINFSGVTVKKWYKEDGKYEAAVKSKDLLFDMQGKFLKEEAD